MKNKYGHEVSAEQCKLDNSVTPEQAKEIVRREREAREAPDWRDLPWPTDGFINDYD